MLSKKDYKLIALLFFFLIYWLIKINADNNLLSKKEIETSSSTNTVTVGVKRVIDGDTIELESGQKVRYIGIDTPETVAPNKPDGCFGKEASAYAKLLLENTKVRIEIDPAQGEFDKYGRHLGYVIMEDGTNFNLKLIEEGFAYEYTYNTPYKYQTEFKKAQADARANYKGLWAEDACY